MELDDPGQAALESQANVRLVTGTPGVGKTFFGCKIAEWELSGQKSRLNPFQKILFLTFARNAVARIRQAYLQQISEKDDLSEKNRSKLKSDFHNRIHINTFAGFFGGSSNLTEDISQETHRVIDCGLSGTGGLVRR